MPARRQWRARAAWALLGGVIVAGSAGRWAPHQPGIWAPTLVNPPDVVRNVLLYVPFGALGMLSLGRPRAARVIAIAIVFSAANEMLQLYTVDRVASLTDIASAAVGTLAGAWPFAARRAPR